MTKTFSAIAAERGDEVALLDEFGETSWSEFDARTNRLIHVLRDVGIGPGETFALLSGNRREAFEAMATAAHLGARFVPLSWHWVADEIAYVLGNADAKALLVDERFAELGAEVREHRDAPDLRLGLVMGLREGQAPPDGLLDYESVLAASSAAEPEAQRAGGPMFYTSGTTGRPKGVLNSVTSGKLQVDLMSIIGKSFSATMGLPPNGRAFLNGPVYHSAQWAYSFLPMAIGQSVVMRHRFDPAETLAVIDRYGVTNIHLVPTQFIRLLRLDAAQRAAFRGESLQVCWHGAAPCAPEVKRAMIDWWGPRISEYYGSTEGSIVSTIDAETWLSRPGSLGRPLDAIEVRVVRADGTTAEPGEVGQIYFRSRLGNHFVYHKDPDKTAAAYLEPGVFTVGDVGYIDADGHLFVSDRQIDMIISGGVNIYPAEIEGVLVTHPAVADAAVFGVPNQEFGEEVKAAVELSEGFEPSDDLAEALIVHCRERLARYKAPRSVDFEKALPRYPTGKLHKRLLRDPYWERSGRSI